MAPVHKPPAATFEDILRREATSDVRAMEIIHGAIVEKVSATFEHSTTQLRLGAWLDRHFRRGGGGPPPSKGWRFGTEAEVEYAGGEIFVHDVAGWRREHVPERPSGRPVRVRPDWTCEILSPSNAKHDLVDKLLVLQKNGVPHYWIADPGEKALFVYALDGAKYQLAVNAGSGETVEAPPFASVPLVVAELVGDDD